MELISEIGGLRRLKELEHLYKGKNILLVTGKKSFELCGAKNKIMTALSQQSVIIFNEFSVNPKLEDAVAGAKVARIEKISVIIAVGGGSVIDMAKLIKAFYQSKVDAAEIAMGLVPVINPDIPFISVPTTAGSGSEATHFAVVYVGKEKFSLADPCLLPDASILDGELVPSGGRYGKSCNALDAMAQAIESAWASGSTEESREYSYAALSICWRQMASFVNPNCTAQIAQEMISAAHLAGKAINISKTTAAHAYSYAFTNYYNIPHGHSVWLTLPAIFELHAQCCLDGNNVTDLRGARHLKAVMKKLKCLMNINETNNIENTLNSFLESIGVVHKMENCGVNSQEKRILISSEVNNQRMGNNPVNLSSYIGRIFRI